MSDQAMGWYARLSASPATIALVGGTIAVVCGLALMAIGGAPPHYIAINSAAVLIGVTMVGVLQRTAPTLKWLMVGGAALLLFTSLFGIEIEGIRRWLAIGPVQMQPAFLLLPLMVIVYARDPGCHWGRFAMAAAALALAMQPDRSMSSMLALVLLIIWAQRRNWPTGLLAVVGVSGWAVTELRADPLSAVRFVENVLADAFTTGALGAVVSTIGALALVAPVFARKSADSASNFAQVAFAVCWVSLLCWSIIASYPTPLLGYGPSAIIGYFLSIIALRKPARSPESL